MSKQLNHYLFRGCGQDAWRTHPWDDGDVRHGTVIAGGTQVHVEPGDVGNALLPGHGRGGELRRRAFPKLHAPFQTLKVFCSLEGFSSKKYG